MESLTYETVARFSMVSSLLLFIALFIIMLVYVFGFTTREGMDEIQSKALDLGRDQTKKGGRA